MPIMEPATEGFSLPRSETMTPRARAALDASVLVVGYAVRHFSPSLRSLTAGLLVSTQTGLACWA
jgi:hypothetical protein